MNYTRSFIWKLFGAAIVLYSIIVGLLIDVPDLPIIHQTIRNLFFHVCMWFSMLVMFFLSFVYSIKYLNSMKLENDVKATQAASVGMFLGFLGIITGMIWAQFTWGKWWVNDPKLNGAALVLIVYFSYFILRSSIPDFVRKAKLAAVYNIIAFVMAIIFIGILPRLAGGSIHPGTNDNSSFAVGELDTSLRLVFYPAAIGWIIIGIWIWNIRCRIKKMEEI